MKSQPSLSNNSIFAKQRSMLNEGLLLIRLFYFSTLLFLMELLYNWEIQAKNPQFVSSWPANWIWQFGDPKINISAVLSGAILFNILSAFFPFNAIVRGATFLLTQIMLAYFLAVNGYNNHSYYGFTLISIMMLALPTYCKSKESSRKFKYQVLATLWLTAGALVTIYFLIGLGNLRGGITQQIKEGFSIFNPQSISYFILEEMQTSGRQTIISKIVLEHHFIFWFGLFIILIKKLSGPFIWALSPRILPLLGLGFILFHLFNGYAFGLPFSHLTFQIAMFLVLNPTRNINSQIFRKRRLARFFNLISRTKEQLVQKMSP